MNTLVIPAVVAVVVGCGLAVIAFVPFVALSYRRRGGMTFWRTLSWLAATVYAMSLWTYTLMPFPTPSEVRCAPVQLRPFQFVDDIFTFDTSSINALMTNPAVLQAVLNVVLFMPLGWFLRQLGGRGIVVATLAGLAASALIELTQLTGIWGLYRCAYRVFDVDDFMMNTLGAIVGSLISLLVFRHRRDGDHPASPRPITVIRRLTGILCDLLIWSIASSAIIIGAVAVTYLATGDQPAEVSPVIAAVAVALPFVAQLVSVLAGGVTLGERVVLIAAVRTRLPAVIARPLRFLAGIGGYMALSVSESANSGLLLGALVIVTAIMVFTTRNHRGFACVVAGIEIGDARAPLTLHPDRSEG